MASTLAQERSAFALQELEKLKGDRDKFKNLAAGLPAMVLQNGFGQALAFLLAKGTDHHRSAFDMVVRWLVKRDIIADSDRTKAILELSKLEQSKYLQAQEEAMKLLEWVKRYAKADLFTG